MQRRRKLFKTLWTALVLVTFSLAMIVGAFVLRMGTISVVAGWLGFLGACLGCTIMSQVGWDLWRN
jgi:hypothetical protein